MNTDLQQRLEICLDWSKRNVEPEVGDMGLSPMKKLSVDEEKRQVHFVCSTGDVDRYGEIVEPEAYINSINAFMDNPILAAGHVYVGQNGEPSVIGHWVKVWVSSKGLEGIAQFDDEDKLAIRYWNLYRKGHMRAVSVGFIANAWQMRDVEINSETKRVRVFTDVNLLEISCVAIPANPQALVKSRSANATQQFKNIDQQIDTAVERAIDKRLSTDPGGPMTLLAQDVAELVVAQLSLSADPYGDNPTPAPGSAEDPTKAFSDEDHCEISGGGEHTKHMNEQLRAALAQAG